MAPFLGLIRRDLRLSLRQGGEIGLVLGFFVLAVILFPFDPMKIVEMHKLIAQEGEKDGIAFDFLNISRRPDTLDSHRLIRWAEAAGVQDEVVERLFIAYFAFIVSVIFLAAGYHLIRERREAWTAFRAPLGSRPEAAAALERRAAPGGSSSSAACGSGPPA